MSEIEDIFSSKKIKEEKIPKTLIIVDSREKNSMILSNLVELKANIKKEKLEIGDYLINEVVLERKTLNDFLNSVYSGRLFNQLANLKSYYKKALILEGDLRDIPEEKAKRVVKNLTLSIKINHQIPIIYTKNEQDTARKLLNIARQQENKNAFSLRKNKKEKTLKELKQFILEGFPEIGPTKARKLLEDHKTLKKIFNLPKKELLKSLDESATKKLLGILNN